MPSLWARWVRLCCTRWRFRPPTIDGAVIGTLDMTYRIYYTNAPLPHGVDQPNIANLIPEVVNSELVAINLAMAALENGWIVWRVEGPDNYSVGRQAINRMYYDKTGRWPRQ